MSSKLAQFPFVRELDGFDFEAQPSLDQGQIRELATCRWIAHGDTVLFLGPARYRQNASGCEPRPRGHPPELQCSVRHGGHLGGDAGEGSQRRLARQTVDDFVAAEIVDHRRVGLLALRGQCRPPVLPIGVPALREGLDPDHLKSFRGRMGKCFWGPRRRHGNIGPPASPLDGDYHPRPQLPASRKAPLRPSAEGRSGAWIKRNCKPMRGSVLQFAQGAILRFA